MERARKYEEDVRRRLIAGDSERKIAEEFNISRRQVRQIKQQIQKDEDHNPFADNLAPTISQATAVEELVKLSTRPEGVRKSEMWPILRARYGMRVDERAGKLVLDMTDNQFAYLKKRVTETAAAQGKDALFIPEWLPRQAPVAANQMLLRMAGWLHDQANEYVSEFIACFPNTPSEHLLNEMVCLAFKQASPEPVLTRCQRNAAAAERLQERLGSLAGKHAANEPFPFAQDTELESLCI